MKTISASAALLCATLLTPCAAGAVEVGYPPPFPVAQADPNNRIEYLGRYQNQNYYTETGLATAAGDGTGGYFSLITSKLRGSDAVYYANIYQVSCPFHYQKIAKTTGNFWELQNNLVEEIGPVLPINGASPAAVRAQQVCMDIEVLLKR